MIYSSPKSRADSRSFCSKRYRRARIRQTIAPQRMATAAAAKRDPAAGVPAGEASHMTGEASHLTGEASHPANEASHPVARQRRDNRDETWGPQATTYTRS